MGAAVPHAAGLSRRHSAQPAGAPAGHRHVLQCLGSAPRPGALPGHDSPRPAREPLLVDANADVSETLSRARFWFALVLLGALGVILWRRWAAACSQRQALAPVLVSGGLVMALAAWYAALLAELDRNFIQSLEDSRYVVMCTVPFAFLAGLLRSRVAGAAAVSEVVARLGDPTIRQSGIGQALADALDGTSLEVAYLDPDGGYVDAAGRQVAVPRGSRIESRSRWRRRRNLRRCSRTTGRARASRSWCARSPRPRRWRWRTSGLRASCAGRSTRSSPPARASSSPAMRRGGGWSEISTTAPSSASCRSRSTCACSARGSTQTPTPRGS